MNTKKIALGLITAFLFWAPAILILPIATGTGCTTPQKEVAFKTLSAIAVTVDSALNAYSDAVVAGKVDLPTQNQVSALKLKYSAAFSNAVAIARGNLQAPAPDDVQLLANRLTSLIKVIVGTP